MSSALGGGGLVLRKCSVSGCTRLCVKQSDSCRQHTDHPPLSKLFEAPNDSFFDPPTSTSPNTLTPRTPTYASSATPPLHPTTPPTYFHSHPSSPFALYSSNQLTGHGSITGRDTLTADRVINTADLIPYEIPVDHEDGKPPPHMEFLYDDLDSGREEAKEQPTHSSGSSSSFTPPATPPLARLSSRASPSSSVTQAPSSGHSHHLNHHILVVDTRVNDRDRVEEKDHFRGSASPISRSASCSTTTAATPSQSSLYMSPRRPSLSPHSPHSPYLPPSTPRSVQALMDRITKLEENNGMLIRESSELKRELDGKKRDEEGLHRTVRELRDRLKELEEKDRERMGGSVSQRKAPVDLPPVTTSTFLSASTPSSSSHFTSRLAAVSASSASTSVSGLPSPVSSIAPLSTRGPQLAPLFTPARPPTSQSSPSSANHHHQSQSPMSPRGHHSAHSYHHIEPIHDKPRSLSHEPLTPSSGHPHPPHAHSSQQQQQQHHQLASHRTHSPSPSSSPLNSRPTSASYSDTSTPSISPVTSFFSSPSAAANTAATATTTATTLHPKALRAVGGGAMGGGGKVKASSNGGNVDGSSMNVGNVLGERPSIRLYPHYATGEAMKQMLTDEGMGIRYEYESK